jgi:myo-inositol-1(or 4)-monophosphatase
VPGMNDAPRRAAVTERAARAGGVVARERFRDALCVETKDGPLDVVTAADRDAQQQVIVTIRQAFTDERLVCEEESTPPGVDVTLETSVPGEGPAWVVDPIDGTANYVRGMRFWATSVAAVRGGEPVAAATYLPVLEDSYTAGPESVSLNDEPMTVSDRTDPSLFAVAVIGRLQGETPVALFRGVSRAFGDSRRLGSMQGALALVAAGRLEGAVTPTTPPPWDTTAGAHLVRRAGGTATDIHGDRWEPGATGLVASNGAAHDRLLEVARAARDG